MERSFAQVIRPAADLIKNPALHLVALLHHTDRTDWMTIHRFHTRESWRGARNPAAKLWLIATVAAWPIFAFFQSIRRTWLYGAEVRRSSGVPIATQWIQQLHLSLVSLVSPKSYYLFELYRPENRARALRYVSRYESKAHAGYKELSPRPPRDGENPGNKLALHDLALEHGLAVAPVLLVAAKGKVKRGNRRDLRLHGTDLIVKPARGKGGKGIELWRRLDSGGFAGPGGDASNVGALTRHVRSRSKKDRMLVQPRLDNHPDLAALAGDALSTVRIITALNDLAVPEATDAVFKMAADGATADNFHRGGLAASVDLVSGSLGKATGLDPNSGHHDRHPTRGATIQGTKLPMWESTVDLALCAHRLFPAQVLLAWDIAITPQGPVLLEANPRPGFHMTQRASGVPMGESRLGQILAGHIRRLEGDA